MLLHGRKEDHGLRHDGQSPLAGQTRRPSCEGREVGSDGPAGDLPLLPAPRRIRRPAGRSERRRWTGSRSFQTQGPPPERSRGAGSPSRPHSPPCRAYSCALWPVGLIPVPVAGHLPAGPAPNQSADLLLPTLARAGFSDRLPPDKGFSALATHWSPLGRF